MKNRKLVIVAFLVVAALVLSVGYATLTDTLTIIGNAHIDIVQAESNFDAKVKFTHSEVVQNTGGTGSTADVANHTDDDATFTANSLATKDEFVQFKYTITNESNVPVKVTAEAEKLSGDPNPTNSNPTYFALSYDYSEDDQIIDSGATMDVTVTVKVATAVTANTSATFGLELTATTVG